MRVGPEPADPLDGSSDWRTPAEALDYRGTPDYAQTMAFLRRLAASHPGQVRIQPFGRTGEGRDLYVVIVSEDGCFSPEVARARGRAVLLVQNAIHAGEMDGKDACLALLRDLLRDPGHAPARSNLVWLFIPVYNVDGHERRSPFNRVNQNGPEEMGWRANGTNLNLNRDYLKADAPETRAFLRLFRRWLPDFFVDNHVTDGADFQYDVTFQLDDGPDVFPATAHWVRESVTPELVRQVDLAGHLAFPWAVFLRDDTDPSRGLAFNENPPRFSTGFMILENRPGLLVELHMLKEYRTRVLGDYAILRALLELLNRDAARLISLNRDADAAAAELGREADDRAPFPLVVASNGAVTPVPFRGYRFERYQSDLSGAMTVAYRSEPWETFLPAELTPRVDRSVVPPVGYIIPPQYVDVIEVLAVHGVEMSRTVASWAGEVERYRLTGMQWPARPFEGRFPILRGGNVEREIGHFGMAELSRSTVEFPAESVVVALNQRRSKVVLHWLEPEAPDSAVRWGFFASIFEQKESGEAYAVERMARELLARDPGLRAEFDRRVASQPEFAADPDARLSFLYRHSPWGEANRVGEYPVARLLSMAGLPISTPR